MSERDGEPAAREAPLAATEPAVTTTRQSLAPTRRTAQLVLRLLVILGLVGLLY